MLIKGNNLYEDIEVETKERAIAVILYYLNRYQIGWEVVYAEQLLEGFGLNKDDFVLYDLSYHYGAYTAHYIPYYTEEEIKALEDKYEEQYVTGLLSNLCTDMKFALQNGMTYNDIKEFVDISKLENIAKEINKHMHNTPQKKQAVFTAVLPEED